MHSGDNRIYTGNQLKQKNEELKEKLEELKKEADKIKDSQIKDSVLATIGVITAVGGGISFGTMMKHQSTDTDIVKHTVGKVGMGVTIAIGGALAIGGVIKLAIDNGNRKMIEKKLDSIKKNMLAELEKEDKSREQYEGKKRNKLQSIDNLATDNEAHLINEKYDVQHTKLAGEQEQAQIDYDMIKYGGIKKLEEVGLTDQQRIKAFRESSYQRNTNTLHNKKNSCDNQLNLNNQNEALNIEI